MIEEVYSYEQPMLHPRWRQGEGIAQAIIDVRSALYSISHMLTHLHNAGDPILPSVSDGVSLIIEQQCLLLNGIAEHVEAERFAIDEAKPSRAHEALPEAAWKLRKEFIEKSAKAGTDPSTIGAAMNLSQDDIERVLRQLRGAQSAHSGAQGGKAVAPRRVSAQA